GAIASGGQSSGSPPGLLGAIHGPFSTSVNPHLSSAVLTRYWIEHPDQAPEAFRSVFDKLHTAKLQPGAPASAGPVGASSSFNKRFNAETEGWPQNEESLAKC